MRRLTIGIAIGFLISASAAWGLTVRFPKTLKVRGVVLVDESGIPLGSTTPVRVEVANPATQASPGTPWNISCSGDGDCFTVPTGSTLRLTDIAVRSSGSGSAALVRNGSEMLRWNFIYEGSFISMRTGIVFSEGESVRISGTDVYQGYTLMGTLEGASDHVA